ncbi:Cullin-1 [Manis pentadactyla]|nr:Cullin-1 [Manis pentadactyla]
MYNLVSRLQNGLGELKKLLEIHIHNQGHAAIEKCGGAALNDSKIHVQTALDIHKKYNIPVMAVFNNDAGFWATLDKACGHFMNNAATKMAQSFSKDASQSLLHQNSASDDAKPSMISKLKQACGFEYTSKLQKVFHDIGVSKDLNGQFKMHPVNSELDLDFSIQVLSFGSWPFQQSCTFALPLELERSYQPFTAFYSSGHSGRKLMWLCQLL